MRTLFLTAVLAALSLAPAAAAPLAFDVTINTASAAGTTALMDFQFNPGMAGFTDAAGATIVSFYTNGALAPTPEPAVGDVTGTLPGFVRINNTDSYNDYAHQLVLGTVLTFRIVLDGPGVEAPTGQPFGSSFAFALLDATTFASILTTSDPDGFLIRADVPATGGVDQPLNFGSRDLVLISDVHPVPEPSTGLLMGAGLIAAAALARRGRRNR